MPKSVSIAWALADPVGAAAIEAAHERAIARTLQRLEEEALATRAGVNGVRQTEVRGGVLARGSVTSSPVPATRICTITS